MCEGEGATWLPFETFGHTSGVAGRASVELVWYSDGGPPQTRMFA